jgi:hypothetical protein
MSGNDLTPEALKQQCAAVIPKADTFKPQGVSEQDARAFLDTDEGALYWYRVAEAAAPGTHSSAIDDRAINQITSGLELPRMETIGSHESLAKIVPAGTPPSAYSPFWTKEAELDAAVKAGKNLSDYFGLPVVSEAARYDIYRITPKVPTQVFVNTVAPTSELGGQVIKMGGAEQSLVPNRQLFTDPVQVRSVDNTFNLTATVERGGMSPNLVRGAGALGAAAVVYDGATTFVRAADLSGEGNVLGAQSQIEHFAGRTVGGLAAGFGAGFAYGALAGSETGPGALVTGLVGGAIGAFGGEKLMDWHDQNKIYNQTDPQGQAWHYNRDQPQQGWSRDLPPLPETPHGQHLRADPALAERLTYQASTTAAELAMGRVGKPVDPYTQPASTKDTPSFGDPPWQRSAQTGQWERQVNAPFVERQAIPEPRTEIAQPGRARELDTAAQGTIAQNLTASKHGIAEQYQAAYQQHRWQPFGPMPEDVSKALSTPATTLEASNSHTYTRSADGQWTTPGMLYGTNTAEGNVRQELDATRAARMAADPGRSIPQPTHVAAAPSAFAREMLAKIDRFDQAMQAGDHAAVMKEVAHVYQTPEWQAEYGRARETAAKEHEQREQYRAEHPRDPRDAGHPDHAMNQSIRKQVEMVHERAGIFISNKELDHLTASVAHDARAQGMTRVDQVQFSGDQTRLVATQQSGQHEMFSKHGATNVQQAMQTPPEHAYQQMAQETQHQAQMQQTIQQQTAQSQQGPSLGR